LNYQRKPSQAREGPVAAFAHLFCWTGNCRINGQVWPNEVSMYPEDAAFVDELSDGLIQSWIVMQPFLPYAPLLRVFRNAIRKACLRAYLRSGLSYIARCLQKQWFSI